MRLLRSQGSVLVLIMPGKQLSLTLKLQNLPLSGSPCTPLCGAPECQKFPADDLQARRSPNQPQPPVRIILSVNVHYLSPSKIFSSLFQGSFLLQPEQSQLQQVWADQLSIVRGILYASFFLFIALSRSKCHHYKIRPFMVGSDVQVALGNKHMPDCLHLQSYVIQRMNLLK